MPKSSPSISSDLFDDFSEMFPGILLLLDDEGFIHRHNSGIVKMTAIPSSRLMKSKWHHVFNSTDPTLSSKEFFHDFINDRGPSSIVTEATGLKETRSYVEWRFKRFGKSPVRPDWIIASGWDITGWISRENKLLRERFRLIERNKELICLYGISQITGNSELSFESKLQQIVELIPQAFQYPEQASAKIELDNLIYNSCGFDEANQTFRLHEHVYIGGRRRGIVQVAYSDDVKSCISEPAFLMEERNLLRIVSRQLALVLEHRDTGARKNELQGQLRHADRLVKIGQLAAGIAHEINTPLGNILGFAQLSAKTEGLPEQVNSDLDRIVKSCLHAREIIRKLMLFSRQLPPRQETADLNAVVEDSLGFIEHVCVKSNVRVVRNFASRLPEIMLDPGQMNQVLMNLIINAVHAMPSGGTLVLETSHDDENVILKISDNGTGMSPDVIEQIFLPFFSTKELDRGTGLGLSVVHGIIKAHGGAISVASREGKGTTFTIMFSIHGGGG